MAYYGSTITTSRLMDIEEKLGLLVNWNRTLNRFEVATIEKNIEENSQRTLTQEEIERFEKSPKTVLAENETMVIYTLGRHIYINRVRVVNPHDIRITFQKVL